MLGNRKKWVADNGQTRTEAIDVNGYPLHDFAFQASSRYDFGWPLQIVTAGDDIWCAGCSRKRFNTPLLAVELVIEGQFRFVQNGRECLPEAGEVFLVRPGSQTMMELYRGEIGRKKVMEITGPLVGPLVNLMRLNRLDCFKPNALDWLIEQYDLAKQTLTQAKPGFMKASSQLAYNVLIDLGRAAEQNQLPIAVRQAITLMEHRINSDVTLQEIIDFAGVTQSTLHRLFIKHLGEAPINYYIDLKMQMAKTSIVTPGATVKSVAAELGYENQQYFSALFKRRVGMSPRLYQRQQMVASDASSDLL